MTHRYDWSKLDAGWSYDGNTGRGGTLKNHDGATWLGSVTVKYLEETLSDAHGWFDKQALDQLTKCRVRDTEPAPPVDGSAVPAAPCPACGKLGLHLCEKFYPEPPSTKSFYFFQPWRRGPLASWTLVNISCHDGRLTVVMKRGRGELIDETGPDDETLWERLGAKVVEFEAKRATK